VSPCFDIRNFAHQQFGCCLPAGTPSQRRRARCPVVGKMARQLPFCCLPAAINQSPIHTLLEVLADDLRLGLCRNAARSPFSCLSNGPPDWLLALEPSVCSAVFLVGVKSAKELLEVLDSRSEDPTLFNRACGSDWSSSSPLLWEETSSR
jgi:hypothetical protein